MNPEYASSSSGTVHTVGSASQDELTLLVDSPSSATTASQPPRDGARPFPTLPTEIKKEILLHCDQPTLAATSLASLALFELSAPILYESVTVEGVQGLRRLLLHEVPVRLPHLSRLLDLDGIKALTYISPVEEGVWEDDPRTSQEYLDLLLGHRPLPRVRELNVVVVVTPKRQPKDFDQAWSRDLTTLLCHFNPTACTISAASPETFVYIDADKDMDLKWTRLERLCFWGVGPGKYTSVTTVPYADVPVQVIYNLRDAHWTANLPWNSNFEMNAVDDMLGWGSVHHPSGFNGTSRESVAESSHVSEVIFQVNDTAQARRTWNQIRVTAWEGRADDERQARWANKLIFELVSERRKMQYVRETNTIDFELVDLP